MSSSHKKYRGYSDADRQTPYAHFFKPEVAAVQAHVPAALAESPVGFLLPLDNTPLLLKPGYQSVETGYACAADGSLRVAVHTQMPGVSPKMWDWWFGWHGCRANRYKLWHPLAHVDAHWQDGRDDVAYVGRVSQIEEYIGSSLEKANIRFVAPGALGLPPNTDEVVHICARLGYTPYPLDFGWLVHQVRAVEGGAEMRSRFWLGGPYIQLRSDSGWAHWVSKRLQNNVRLPARQAADLLQHCAEEMNHLALILPGLYHENN